MKKKHAMRIWKTKFATTRLFKALLLCTALFLVVSPFIAAQKTADVAKAILVQETALAQKITLHLAQDFFIAGEKIWFSIQVRYPNGKPAAAEKIAFVELLNNDGKSALQTTIALTNGTGNGALTLPTDLTTGNYLFRAYTSALRNEPAAFAVEEIAVVNGSKPPTWASIEQEGPASVQLFPEGGRWIAGLQNITAVCCATSLGEGIQAKGILINEAGDTVLQTATDANGKALFNWTPGNQQYRFIVRANGKNLKEIPLEVFDDGLSIQMNTLPGGQTELHVNGTENFINKPVYVTLPTRTGVRLMQQVLSASGATFRWRDEELAEGLWQIKVYDADGGLRCVRWCLGKREPASELKIETDKNAYGLRQKVSVNLAGVPANAVVTASAFLVDSLQTLPRNTSSEELDLWLRTMPADITTFGSGPGHSMFDLPQYEGALVLAQIKDKQTGKPVPDINAFLSIPGKDFQLASATSNADGLVQFAVKSVMDNRESLLQLHPADAAKYNIIYITPFSEKQSTSKQGRLRLSQTWAAQLEQRVFAAQVQKVFEDSILLQQAKKDTLPFYGLPDKSYLLDDYTRFPTLDEVMREYVAEVMVRRRNGETHYQVFNLPYKQLFDTDPLLLLDGVPFFETEKIMAVDPLKLKKLEVVSRRWAHGHQTYDGIVSFTTYEGSYADVAPSAGAVAFVLPGAVPKEVFQSPDYSKAPQPHTPDQRTQLFWQPALQTDASGKAGFSFFTSDVPGRYAILIRASAANGAVAQSVLYIDATK